MICEICCENLSHSTNSSSKKGRVLCFNCDIIVCRSCVQKYIETRLDSICCMNCKTQWSNEFINKNLQKTFLKTGYYTNIENRLLLKEKLLFRETRNKIFIKKLRTDLKSQLDVSNLVLNTLLKEYNIISFIDNISHKLDLIKRIRVQSKVTRNIKLKINNLGSNIKKYNVNFYCFNKSCNGMLDPDFKCLDCKKHFCMQCFQIKSENHVCKKKDLQTVNEIYKNAKQCPGCNNFISKISGCDEMFCTRCKTAFSWSKGIILIKEQIHNPHYSDYLRNIKETSCVQINLDLIGFKIKYGEIRKLSAFILNNRDDLLLLYNITKRNPIKKILKTLIKFSERLNDELDYWNRLSKDDNDDIREKFLLGEINEKQFKRILRLRYLRKSKFSDIKFVLLGYRIVLFDIFLPLWNSDVLKLSSNKILELIDNITSIRHYYNKEIQKIILKHKIFGPYISNTHKIYNVNGIDFSMENIYSGDLIPSYDLEICSKTKAVQI